MKQKIQNKNNYNYNIIFIFISAKIQRREIILLERIFQR